MYVMFMSGTRVNANMMCRQNYLLSVVWKYHILSKAIPILQNTRILMDK